MKWYMPNPLAHFYGEEPEECFIIRVDEKPQGYGHKVKEEKPGKEIQYIIGQGYF